MTKRKRHRIYCQALMAFDEGEMDGGLCELLVHHTDIRYWSELWKLTEFYDLKPKRAGDGFWWPRTKAGNARRREHLVKCIELTKPVPRNKKKK